MEFCSWSNHKDSEKWRRTKWVNLPLSLYLNFSDESNSYDFNFAPFSPNLLKIWRKEIKASILGWWQSPTGKLCLLLNSFLKALLCRSCSVWGWKFFLIVALTIWCVRILSWELSPTNGDVFVLAHCTVILSHIQYCPAQSWSIHFQSQYFTLPVEDPIRSFTSGFTWSCSFRKTELIKVPIIPLFLLTIMLPCFVCL